jgi:hypothetical protein
MNVTTCESRVHGVATVTSNPDVSINSHGLNGDAITFGQLIGTQMDCINIGEADQAFRAALKSATLITARADRLELSDTTGKQLAVFAARVQSAGPATADLAGTSWQLVKFQGSDGATLTPEEHHVIGASGRDADLTW